MLNNLLVSTGGAIIDCLALIVIALLTILGAKLGFVKTFVSVFGYLISIILAALLCSTVALFFERKFGTISGVSSWLSGITSRIFGQELMNTPLSQANEQALNGNLALWLVNIVFSAKNNPNISDTTTLNQVISPVFAYYIVAVLSFIILYILFRLILFIIGDLVNKAHKIKLVKKVDCSLGALLGFIRAVVIIGMVVWIIGIIPIGFIQDFKMIIDSSIITNFFANINIVSLIVNAISSINIGGIIESVVAH